MAVDKILVALNLVNMVIVKRLGSYLDSLLVLLNRGITVCDNESQEANCPVEFLSTILVFSVSRY